MQWDASLNAGFTSGRPWLPIDSNYSADNVAALRQDPHSLLALYQLLITIRKGHPALVTGQTRVLGSENNVLIYERANDSEKIIIALNFGTQPQTLKMPQLVHSRLLLSTLMDQLDGSSPTSLRGNEGIVLLCNG
jgi:glycosidase